MGMKQIFVMMAAVVLVGCGTAGVANGGSSAPLTHKKLISDPIVEKAIHESLEKPKGELTEADLDQVVSVNFGNSKITDAGLRELAKLQNLKGLSLEDTKITDAGLKNVARLENLQDLWLHNTSITDVGLKEVAKMKQLKSVSMFTGGGAPWTYGAETRATFTRAGMAELRKALPNCRFNP